MFLFISPPWEGAGEAFVKKGCRVATDDIRRRTKSQQPFLNEQLTMNNVFHLHNTISCRKNYRNIYLNYSTFIFRI
jgi:hypothetical protein